MRASFWESFPQSTVQITLIPLGDQSFNLFPLCTYPFNSPFFYSHFSPFQITTIITKGRLNLNGPKGGSKIKGGKCPYEFLEKTIIHIMV